MGKAKIKCADCDRNLEFGGMSANMRGSISQYDAVAMIAGQLGWKAKGGAWRCPDHG